jgi:hypothetical protein
MEKCKKSSGLHWDIVLICLLNVPTSLVGGPWMCVALVRCILNQHSNENRSKKLHHFIIDQ